MSTEPFEITYITRKFPPSIGGMERLSSQIFEILSAETTCRLIALRPHSNFHLVWFLPTAFVRIGWTLLRSRTTHVLVGDPVVLIALTPLVPFWGRRMSVVVHGRDVTFRAPGYRPLVRFCLNRVERVLPISGATEEAVKELAPTAPTVLLRLGIAPPDPISHLEAREWICRTLDVPPESFILVSVGRLQPRKGIEWFVRGVLPDLDSQVVLVVAGSGPADRDIRRSIAANSVEERVRLLGEVDELSKNRLMAGADLFVMPNITVPGDIEGFGLVAAEAAAHGTPVIASDMEGIRDAVVDGVTGSLIPTGDRDRWATVIQRHEADRRLLGTWRAGVAAAARDRLSTAPLQDSLLRALGQR